MTLMPQYNWMLKQRMRERNITQKYLAERVRISTGQMSAIVNGKRDPGPKVQTRIAQALGCGVDEIF